MILTRSETISPQTPRAPQKSLMVWLGILLFFSALHAVGLLFQIGGEAYSTLRGDLLNIPPSFLAALIVFMVSRQHTGTSRRMWFWLSLGLFSLGVADCVWAYLELVLKSDPFPSLADAFYVLQPIALLTAFWFAPRDRAPSRLADVKLSVDIAISMTAILLVAWRVYLASTILEYNQQYLALGLSLTYPIMDLLQLTMLFLLVFSGRAKLAGIQVVFLGLGLACFSLVDLLFNIQEATNSYITGSPTDLLSMIGAVLFGLGAIMSLNQATPISTSAKLFNQKIKWLNLNPVQIITRIAIITVYVVYAVFHSKDSFNETGALILAGVVIVLALWRQSLELNDNAELNRNLVQLSSSLEQRVQERTAELQAKTVQLEQSRAQLLASEKLANLGRFTAGVAHEVNTPLAASLYDLSHAQKLVLEYKNSILAPSVTGEDHLEIAAELEATHERINSSLERLGRFIRRVREQSRTSTTASYDFDARLVLRDAFVHLEYQALEQHVRLEINLPDEPVMVHGDPQRLGQILNELVLNGIQACPTQPEQNLFWVRIALGSNFENVILSVQDNGLGLGKHDLPHIFEPMYAHKPTEHSGGLGLSVVHDIIKGHFLGDIRVSSQLGQGTRFEVMLPKPQPVKENP